MKFERIPPPRRYTHYRRYREYTREVFQRLCAYCFRHEIEAGGQEHFDQDHFEPKSRPNVDPADYSNLYWSCKACNSQRNKGVRWPTPEQLEKGQRFCDPCHHDPVGTDYVLNDDGRLDSVTPAGQYTIRHIRLNKRSNLIGCRKNRIWMRQRYRVELQNLRRTLESATALTSSQMITADEETRSTLLPLVEAYESYVARDPFAMEWPPEEVLEDIISGIVGGRI